MGCFSAVYWNIELTVLSLHTQLGLLVKKLQITLIMVKYFNLRFAFVRQSICLVGWLYPVSYFVSRPL